MRVLTSLFFLVVVDVYSAPATWKKKMLLDSCPHALIQNTHPECERSAESLACRQDRRGGCCETRHPHPSLLSACVEIVGHSGRALLRQPRRSLYGRFRPPNQLQSRWERGNSPSANVVFCRPAHADNVCACLVKLIRVATWLERRRCIRGILL